MPGPSNEGRPSLVVAMEWVTQITTIGLEMALPAGLGYWLDTRWGTAPWLLVAGAILGFFTAMRHLLKLTSGNGKRQSSHKRDE